jgi:hypothetical protein
MLDTFQSFPIGWPQFGVFIWFYRILAVDVKYANSKVRFPRWSLNADSVHPWHRIVSSVTLPVF